MFLLLLPVANFTDLFIFHFHFQSHFRYFFLFLFFFFFSIYFSFPVLPLLITVAFQR